MIALVTIDLVTLAGLSWAPFDSYPGATPFTELIGILSMLVQMLDYLCTVLLLTENEVLFYLIAFAVTLFQLVLLSKGVMFVRRKLAKE